jgi:predicted DCC family thiol-disulfide oxidoreductase YuxK
MTTNKATLFFDGGCPLCSREISHYQKIDHAQRVNWVDIHADPEVLVPHGIEWIDAMKRIHLIDTQGQLQTGAYAFVSLWSQLPYYQWLAKLCAFPGIVPLMDWGYRHFADWRWKRRSEETCQI